MRFKIILLLVVGVSLAGSAAASLAGIWQFPLETDWDIDPEFRFGSAYAGTTHLGEDVAAPAGTPVFAAANGTVKLTANFPGYHDWGGLILIENQNVTGSVVVSLYGHLDSRSFGVVPGQTVNRGQMLGRLGDSSRNGQWKPHIHFGLRKGYYQSSPWVYRGFGSGGELSNWHPAHTYVPARAAVKEVSRVPIAGRNRYETAAAASQWQYPAAGSAGAVIIASGERYQDALAGTVLAQLRRAPLLLTQAHQVPMETVNELTRAITPGAPVYLIGGPDVVSPQVSDYLGSLGYSVERLAGLTAPETSTVVAESLPSSSTVFVASSRSFADGLSAGAPAAELGAPLLLTEPDRLSHSVGSFLQSRQPGQIYLVGGEAALSYAVSEQIKDLLPAAAVERLSGYDRYATNRFVNERFISAPKVITIASGERYQDALVGSVLAAQQGGALILSARTGLKAQVEDYIAAVEPTTELALVMGGGAVLTTSVDQHLGLLLNPGVIGAGLSGSTLTGSAIAVNWDEAPRETHNGFSLPVPIGARVVTEEIGGIQSSVLYQGEHQEKQESQEKQEHTSELDTLLVARATPDGSDDHSLVASWLGVARDKVVALGHERFLVRQAITDRYVQVERAEGSVNLYSVPSAALLDLLELATELN